MKRVYELDVCKAAEALSGDSFEETKSLSAFINSTKA